MLKEIQKKYAFHHIFVETANVFIILWMKDRTQNAMLTTKKQKKFFENSSIFLSSFRVEFF